MSSDHRPGATLPTVFAHRGVSKEFPENSLEAFGAAKFRGADGVELDVRVTADGGLAVHHDARLEDGRIIAHVLTQDLPSEVPTLEQALDACGGLTVNIELKNLPGEPDFDPTSAIADQTVAIVSRLAIADKVLVSSFNRSSLDRVRQLDPSIQTGWLVFDLDEIEVMLDHVTEGGHVALHPPAARTTRALIKASHDRGIKVNTWTVDDPIRIVQLAGDGVDGIITNVPDVAREALLRWLAQDEDG